MKHFTRTLALLAGIALLTGCSSIETNRGGSQMDIICTQEFKPTVKVADQTIAAEATVTSLLGIFNWGVNNTATGVDFGTDDNVCFKGAAEIAREGAVYAACVNNNADFLVTPRYTLTTEGCFLFKTVKCKVIGFPGQIIKVTPVED